MKKCHTTSVLSLLLLTLSACAVPLYAHAQSGTYFDPIHVQIEPDIFDSYVQQTKTRWQVDSLNNSLQGMQNSINSLNSAIGSQTQTDTLIRQYGYDAYRSCSRSCGFTGSDDPINVQRQSQSCAYQIESCMRRYSASVQQFQPMQRTNTTPTAGRKADCAVYGANFRANGDGTCQYVGPATSPQINAAVTKSDSQSVATKTDDQRCKDSFGAYSYWTGQTNEKGPFCSCSAGYQWTTDMKSCVAIQPTTDVAIERDAAGSIAYDTPQTNNQLCQESYGSHSSWHGTLNSQGGPVCECATGYEVTNGKCTQTPILYRVPVENIQSMTTDNNIKEQSASTNPKQERRGFWSWLLGVFGI